MSLASSSDRWRRVEEVYHAAHARPANDRAAFLAEACAGDEPLRREVQSLLDQPGSGHGALEGGALAMAAKAFAPILGRLQHLLVEVERGAHDADRLVSRIRVNVSES